MWYEREVRIWWLCWNETKCRQARGGKKANKQLMFPISNNSTILLKSFYLKFKCFTRTWFWIRFDTYVAIARSFLLIYQDILCLLPSLLAFLFCLCFLLKSDYASLIAPVTGINMCDRMCIDGDSWWAEYIYIYI